MSKFNKSADAPIPNSAKGCPLHVLSFILFTALICNFPAGNVLADVQNNQSPHRKATAAIHCDFSPDYYWDKNANKASGFGVELTEKIAERAGFQVNYVCRDNWPEIITLVESGEADFALMGISEERKKRVDFTVPFDTARIVFFAPAGSELNMDNMEERHTVGVLRNSISSEALKNYSVSRLIEYNSHQQGIFGLLSGEVDLYLGLDTAILDLSRRIGREDAIKIAGSAVEELKRGFAVRKGNEKLLGTLNKAMNDFMGSREYDRVHDKWHTAPGPYWNAKRVAFSSVLLMFILISGMGMWRHFSIRNLNKELLKIISERKKAEEALSRRELELKVILDSTADGILAVDGSGKTINANRRFADLWRIPQADTDTGDKAMLNLVLDRLTDPETFIVKFKSLYDTAESGIEALSFKDGRALECYTAPMISEGSLVGRVWSFRDVTGRKQAEELIRRKQEQLSALNKTLVETEERERKKIVEELHDDIGQNLTALSINLGVVKNQLPENMEFARSRIIDSLGLLKQTTEQLRNLMAKLRPPVLDDYGLLAALKWHAKKFAARAGITIETRGEEFSPRLSPDKEIIMFRIAQEALTNISKHAGATHAVITVESRDDKARMLICDNGAGFSPRGRDEAENVKGWGVLNMIERARNGGGSFAVESIVGKGACVIVELPK